MSRRISVDTWGRALAATLGLSLIACGGQTSSTGPGTSGGGGGGEPNTSPYPCSSPTPVLDADGQPTGFENCADGSLHRAEVVTCTSSLPRPDVTCTGAGGGTCTTDADCTDKPYGMCVSDLSGACGCNYLCTTDADCSDGALCRCGAPAGYCISADCRSDADCAGTLECLGYPIHNGLCGDIRFECQTPSDSCTPGTCPDACVPDDQGVHSCGQVSCAVPGRPFLVGGRATTAPPATRSDWLGRLPARATDDTVRAPQLSPDVQERIANHFSRAAAMEHASVAAFARFTLELLALGAPRHLVEASIAAGTDELRHAELCYTLASRFAARPVGPGPLDVRGALDDVRLESVLEAVVREGCIGETVAALTAAEALAAAEDAEVVAALTRIVEDETRHAGLAWRFVEWALSRDPSAAGRISDILDAEVQRHLSESIAEPMGSGTVAGRDAATAAAYGVLDESAARAVARDALGQVVVPLFEALSKRVSRATVRTSPSDLPRMHG